MASGVMDAPVQQYRVAMIALSGNVCRVTIFILPSISTAMFSPAEYITVTMIALTMFTRTASLRFFLFLYGFRPEYVTVWNSFWQFLHDQLRAIYSNDSIRVVTEDLGWYVSLSSNLIKVHAQSSGSDHSNPVCDSGSLLPLPFPIRSGCVSWYWILGKHYENVTSQLSCYWREAARRETFPMLLLLLENLLSWLVDGLVFLQIGPLSTTKGMPYKCPFVFISSLVMLNRISYICDHQAMYCLPLELLYLRKKYFPGLWDL